MDTGVAGTVGTVVDTTPLVESPGGTETGGGVMDTGVAGIVGAVVDTTPLVAVGVVGIGIDSRVGIGGVVDTVGIAAGTSGISGDTVGVIVAPVIVAPVIVDLGGVETVIGVARVSVKIGVGEGVGGAIGTEGSAAGRIGSGEGVTIPTIGEAGIKGACGTIGAVTP
jgi:hypothetical protein